jgi:phosphoserine phosphatase RsbU/P
MDKDVPQDQRARKVGWIASLATLAALVTLDASIDASVAVLTVLFALAPLMACAFVPARGTAVIALLALAAAIVSGTWNGVFGNAQHLIRILDVALVGGAATFIASVRVRREQQYAEMARIAEVAQRAILPVLPASSGGMEISARYASAVQGALVGGDLYDCYHEGDVTRLLIGDVRGKGIEGVEQAARVIRAFRQAAASRPTLLDVVEHMDAYLTRFFDDEEFVTALFVEPLGPGRLALVSAGHPPALVWHRSGDVESADIAQGLPLGTGLPATFTTTELTWRAGDRVLLYTDGLSEARDAHGEFLDLSTLGAALADPDPLDGVLRTVRDHVRGGTLADDLALVLLERAA